MAEYDVINYTGENLTFVRVEQDPSTGKDIFTVLKEYPGDPERRAYVESEKSSSSTIDTIPMEKIVVSDTVKNLPAYEEHTTPNPAHYYIVSPAVAMATLTRDDILVAGGAVNDEDGNLFYTYFI